MPKRAAKPKLGRLEKLDPTDYWQTQAEFQQWFTEAETLDLLGEAAGLNLEPAEEDTLPELGYALLRETDTGAPVLVAAHRSEPDLTDLGPLLAWAAAENAAVVIWVAPDFSATAALTLDWLDQSSEITFLGLTVELWRIGKTAMAANFIPVCGAVDDGEPDSEAEPVEDLPPKEPEPEPLTPLQQQNLEFWGGLCDRMDRQGSLVKPGSPTPEATMGFAIARAGFRLNAILDRDHGSLYTELLLSGIDAQPHFHLLAEEREAIADEMGLPLIWDGTGDQACMVASTLAEVNLDDRDRWPEYQAWFCDCLERFYEAFFDRIKRLDANGYQPLPKRAAVTDALVLPARPRG